MTGACYYGKYLQFDRKREVYLGDFTTKGEIGFMHSLGY